MNIKKLTLMSENKNMSNKTIPFKLFDNPFKLFGNVDIVNKSDGDRIISGYCNLAVVDSQNQLIPLEVLKDGLNTLLSDPAYANLMLVHKNIQVGKIISEYGKFKTHVDDKGAYIVCQIRKDIQTANNVWESILKGELNGFSIGCEVLDEHMECESEDSCITVLDKINIFEVSLTSCPVNEMSGFVVISKSKFNGNYVCEDCEINEVNMKKKEKSEEEEETVKEKDAETSKAEEEVTKDETTELSVDERIEKLERSMLNIEAALTKIAGETEKSEEKEKTEEVKSEETDETKEEEKSDETVTEETKEEPDELKKSISEVADELSKVVEKLSSLFSEEKERQEIENLKLEIKSKDDKIEALEKKVEILSKEDVEKTEPKTVNKSDDEEDTLELEDDSDIIIEKGTVSKGIMMY